MGQFDYSIDLGKDLKKVAEVEKKEESGVTIQPVKDVPPVILSPKFEAKSNFKVELQEVHGVNSREVREVHIHSEVQQSSANVREESNIKVDPEAFRQGSLADPTHLEKDKFAEEEMIRRKIEEEQIGKPSVVGVTVDESSQKFASAAKLKQERFSDSKPSKTWHKLVVLALIVLLAFAAWKYVYNPIQETNGTVVDSKLQTSNSEPVFTPEEIIKNKQELESVLKEGLTN